MQLSLYPVTPNRPSHGSPTSYSHMPLHSSPLASPTSSPASEAQARRRSQYKSNEFTSPVSHRTREMFGMWRRSSGGKFVQGSSIETATTPIEEAPRKAFLRERLKARCIERAVQKRERAISRGSRHLSSEPSSDGFEDMMEEDDEDEDSMLNDELFTRIMQSARIKQRHQYRLSYALDVGSSFDPDMEDPGSWESELRAPYPISTEPQDLMDEELEAYAAEADLNLDDLQAEDIFNFSDLEDGAPPVLDHDVDMH